MADTPRQEEFRRRQQQRKPQPSEALRLRQQEYRTFGREYVKPVVETAVKAVEKERQQEESTIRAAWSAELSKSEFDVWKEFKQSLEEAKQQAKASFEQQLAETTAMSPMYSESREASKEAIESWQKQQRKYFEEQLESWEAQETAKFESHVSEWKGEQESEYQKQISEWRKQWRPKGIAERMMEWVAPTYDLRRMMRGEFAHRPLAPVAGMVASVESFVYGIGGLAGLKTPRPPPTLTGGFIGKGVGLLTGKPSAEFERAYEEYGREYAGGTLVGDVILGIGLAKGAEKALKPVVTGVKTAWKGSRPEMWLIRRGGWYAKHAAKAITRGEVSLPTVPAQSVGVFEPSHAYLKAGELAWELTMAPRTAGIGLTKTVPLTTELTKTLLYRTLIFGGGKLTILPRGYFKETMFEKPSMPPLEELIWKGKQLVKTEPLGFTRTKWTMGTFAKTYFEKARLPTLPQVEHGLLPYLTQSQVTRLGILPHIPKPLIIGLSETLLSKSLLKAGGIAALLGLKAFTVTKPAPKPKLKPKPVLKPKPIMREILKPWTPEATAIMETQREKTVTVAGLKSVLVQELKTEQIASQILTTRSPIWSPPRTQISVPKPPRKRQPKKKKRKRKPKIIKSRIGQYEIVYPIATASEAAKYMLSGVKIGKRKR